MPKTERRKNIWQKLREQEERIKSLEKGQEELRKENEEMKKLIRRFKGDIKFLTTELLKKTGKNRFSAMRINYDDYTGKY